MSVGNCTAVGGYTDSSGHQQGLLLSESSGSWAGAEAPLPANAAATLAAGLASVSCASAGNCTAVGSYGDSSGHGQGLLESFGAAISGVPAISKLRLSPRKVSLAGRRVHGRCVKQTNKNKSEELLFFLLPLLFTEKITK